MISTDNGTPSNHKSIGIIKSPALKHPQKLKDKDDQNKPHNPFGMGIRRAAVAGIANQK